MAADEILQEAESEMKISMQEVYYGVFSGIKAVEGREGSRNGQRKKFSVYPTGNFILGGVRRLSLNTTISTSHFDAGLSIGQETWVKCWALAKSNFWRGLTA